MEFIMKEHLLEMTRCQQYRQLKRRECHKSVSRSRSLGQFQNVVLLSLADIEGPSDFTSVDPLLLMSSPWKRPSWSFCNMSEIWWEFVCCIWWVGALDGEWPNGGNCMFWWWPEGPECGGIEKKFDPANCIWCIPRFNSEGFIASPVATLSLSTSFIKASLRAAPDRNKFQLD